jgi:uncharacterized protein
MQQTIESIHYPFAIDAGLGTLAEENTFSRHVRQMIMQVLFTNPGERINRPDFGCGLRRMVFEPNSEVTANLLKVLILQSLETWLGSLISVLDVTAEAKNEILDVRIVYVLKTTQERQYLNLELTI